MKPLLLLASILLTLCLPGQAQAATRNVPAQYATIQAAVNAAANGDTVQVADGTYTGDGDRDIDFLGKSIIVASQHGPASTIIDCQASAATVSHRGFIMDSGELNATISGFTIKNGYQVQNLSGVTSGSGGGIFLGSNTPGSSLTVSNCIITHCLADSGYNGGVGGGIYAATNSAGTASTITISNCTITNNTAVYNGGGVDGSAAGNATFIMADCTLTGNTAADGPSVGSGGGAYESTDSLSGAGAGKVIVVNCAFANNTAAYEGGGVNNTVNTYGTISLVNCTFTGNLAASGGGSYNYGGTQKLTNCSFTGNSGDGLYDNTALTLTNVILYGDTGGEIENGQPTATHCDVQGGYAGTSNINADPKFVSATDLHLQAGSPCISTGIFDASVPTDKDGKTRSNPTSIGAYEASAAVTLAATTTTVTSSPNPSQTGQTVTLNIQVANGTQAAPTGTIQLSYNGSNLGPAETLDTTGQFSYTITGLTVAANYVFTVTYSGDTHDQGSVGTVTQTVTTTHILWDNANGAASIWNYSTTDGTFTQNTYGPYAGWTAKALADGGTDSLTRVLWTNTDGRMSLWSLNNAAGTFTQFAFGPYPSWTASALSVAADNTTHVLWTNTDGRISLWNYSTATGTYTHQEYGPYANWTATALADGGTDGQTRVLWDNTDGRMSLWSLNNVAGTFSQNTFGPYQTWTAKTVSVGGDNTTHVLWDSTDGRASIWNYSTASGSFTQNVYGAYPGWTAVQTADGLDGKTRVLWANTTGMISLWSLDNTTGVFSQFTSGPYSGWTAAAVSAP